MRPFRLIPVLLLALSALPLNAQSSGAMGTPAGQSGLLGIYPVKVKPGVDPMMFERFVTREFVPKASRFYPGVKLMVVKGDRGEHLGDYLYILQFDSEEIRDLYFPRHGEASAVFNNIAGAYGGMDALRGLYDKFAEYAETGAYTDYAVVH